MNDAKPKGHDKDFKQDAGQYPNECCTCGEWFVGNKGRLECRECHDKTYGVVME